MARRALLPSFVAVLAVSGLLGGCGGDAPARAYVGYRQSTEQRVDALAVPDVADGGRAFRFAAEPGGILLTYFGFTSCPDICPTTLSDVRRALAELGADAERIDLAMITVDPARDTDEVLTGYVRSFVDDAAALRTDDPALLAQVAAAFGASYSVTTDAAGDVQVAHSAALYAVDAGGRVTLTWPFGVTADDIAADLDQLLAEVP